MTIPGDLAEFLAEERQLEYDEAAAEPRDA